MASTDHKAAVRELITEADFDKESILALLEKAVEVVGQERCDDIAIIITRKDGSSIHLGTSWGTKNMISELEIAKQIVMSNLTSQDR